MTSRQEKPRTSPVLPGHEGQELVILPPKQAFADLGIRISLAGPPFRYERQHILDSVKQLRDQVQSHKYNLDQIVEPIHVVRRSARPPTSQMGRPVKGRLEAPALLPCCTFDFPLLARRHSSSSSQSVLSPGSVSYTHLTLPTKA